MRIRPTLSIGLAVFAIATTGTHAASIAWSSLNNGVDTDVRIEGSLLEAANFGGTGVPDVTVNSVAFTGIDFVAGDTLTNMSGLPYNNFQNGHATTTGGNIDTLFDTIGFLSQDSAHTVSLNGLTSGLDYVVQFFLNHPPTVTRTQTFTNGAGDSIVVNNSPGFIVTGEFTADGTSQTITFQTNQGSQLLNGYQLRQIPEPSSAMFFFFSCLLFVRRRIR